MTDVSFLKSLYRLGLAALFSLSLAGPALAQDAEPTSDAEVHAHGRALIADNCGACHGVGVDDESTHEEAPPLRTLDEQYPVADLAEALAEGIMSGHPDMPVLSFEVEEIDQIIAYLESIQETAE